MNRIKSIIGRIRTPRVAVLFAPAAAILLASVAFASDVGFAGRLIFERESHTATLLGKGTVLLVGGRDASGPVAGAEIYDPVTRTFAVAGTSLEARADHAAVRLADGRVLVIGGRGANETLASTELFDPKTSTFSAGPSLAHARFGHTATLLADGRVVVIGGDAAGSAEIYEPGTGLFRELADCLSVARGRHAAVLLRDGNVLVAGGLGSDGAPLASAEILASDTLAFSDSPIPMLTSRSGLTLRVLPDGKVQAIGGDREATMELFNPAGRYFSSLGHLGQDAAVLSAALRNSGRAALIGSPASSRPALQSLSAEGAELESDKDALDISHYTLTELPGTNTAILVGGLTGGALQSRAVLFDASSATVTTDKSDYSPGQTVHITGTGWLPGETVTLNIHRDTNDPPDTVLTAVADPSGNISNSEYVVQEYDLGVTFILTATGQTSGYTAQTTFTDGALKIKSAVWPGSASPRTFGVTVQPFIGSTNCTTGGQAVSSGTADNNGLNTGNIGGGDSWRIVANPTANAPNATFTFESWSNPDALIITVGTATTPIICVQGFQSGTRDLIGNYSGNAPPVITTMTVTPEPSNEGSAVNASATFTDANATDTHTCSVNWGDGSPPQSGTVTEAAGSGTCNVGPHTYPEDGTFPITITVTDNVGASDSEIRSHVVNNVAPVINNSDLTLSPTTVNENDSVNLSGTFTDPGTADTHTVTINWGDGSANTTINLAAGVTSFGPVPHQYLDDNPTATASDVYSITVTVADDDGGSDGANASVTVNNVAPVVAAPTTNSPTNEGSSATASASFTDAGTQDTHTCSINWGDGNTTAGTVAAGACTGSHTYADNGSFTVAVTVTDDDTGSHSNSVSHTVANVNPTVQTPVITPSPSNEGQLVNLSASFTDPGTADTHTCSINWGDGNTTAGTVAAGACTGSHTYGDNGSYTVTVTVTDDDLGPGSNSATQVVNNVAPTVAPPTVVPEPSLEGSSATASATFTDPGANDAPFTCTVNYGDGSGALAGTVVGNTCTGPAHVYGDNGSYTVTVTVTDKDGGPGSNSSTHVVNNVAPTVATPTVAPPSSIEGDSVTASATFTDPGANDAPFTCTVNYGDGSGAQAGTVVGNTCTGPAHTYADNGLYTVTVAVTDKDGSTGNNSTTHSVANANPVVATPTTNSPTNEGSLATASATFTDAGTADTHTCSINWGDGNTTSGTVTQGAGSGSCSGSHTYADEGSGSYTVTFTITDDDGGSGNNSVSHTVLNVPPTITNVSVSPEPSIEGNLDTVTATFTDPGTADVHTCSINWGDGSPLASGTVAAGSCSGTHTYADNGSYTVSVTVDDGDGGSDTESTTHIVANASPSITAVTVTPEPSDEGSSASVSAPFTDAGTADTHTCTINWGDGSPTVAGTVIEVSGSGSCSGSHTYADEGSFTVTVTVTDDDTGFDTETTTHVVQNVAPTVGAVTVAPEPSNEGQSVTASASFTDPGTLDTHTCTVDYGDGSGALAGTVSSGTCTGPAHTYVDEGTGSYTVTVSVSDGDGGTGSNSTSHGVLNVAPTVNTPTVVPSSSNEGQSVTASATFTDPGTLDTHTCTVNYGDGSGALAGTVASGTCTGPAHTYVDDGTFTVTVTVTDNDGGPGSNSTSHTVANLAPVVGAVTTNSPTNEGASATASASFTDAGTADTHTCSINWGDGITTSGAVTQGSGSGSCSGSHTYTDDGSFTVTITIDDGDGGSDDNSATHVVNNVAPVVAAPTTDSPTNEGSSASASSTFSDAGTADTHTCTINWGDGNTTSGSVTEASGSGTCSGTHSYGDNGTYAVAVTVNDGDGGVTTSASTNHVVNNVAPTVGTVVVSPEPSVEGGAVTASATFTDPGANDAPFTCTVNYGDGSGALPGSVSGNTCNGPSHVYSDNNTYTVTIAVTDKDGGTGSNSGSHAVTNAAPVITSITGPTDPIQIGGSATVTATFTDAGTADTHTCSISWGDGNTTAGAVIEASGSGSCSGSHTYSAPGVYQVTVTVTDDDGGFDTEVYSEYIVIFDPNGGFVTGGGWINSPPGAYLANPAAVGKANFGFVSKYKRGASVPEGETEFQFKAGDLNFHSTSYEWMVISGPKARYRGVGTINGSGSYAFELTAWDGQVNNSGSDKFRIVIYGVYDNQLGADDGVDPTTALGGGSIVIHKGK